MQNLNIHNTHNNYKKITKNLTNFEQTLNDDIASLS